MRRHRHGIHWCFETEVHSHGSDRGIALLIKGRKRKEDASGTNGDTLYHEWILGKEAFDGLSDPWERTKRLLIEIQKRSLAEQVLLISWDNRRDGAKVLCHSPAEEKYILGAKLRQTLIKAAFKAKKTLACEDLWHDDALRKTLQRTRVDTLLIVPLTITDTLIDALIVVNYSTWGEVSRVREFISYTSSIVALSLQNFRLFMELEKRNLEIHEWTQNADRRIIDGTKELFEQEKQYYALFEATQDGILVHDMTGRIIEVNRAACDILDYQKDELTGMSWKQLGISDVLPEQVEFFRKTLKKQKLTPLETLLRKKDGTLVRVELTSRRVHFRGNEAIQSYIRDISMRTTLSDSYRETKEKYRIFIESSLVGVYIMRNGILHFVNGMFETITGYSKDELIDKNFYDLIAPEDRSKVRGRESKREQGEDIPRCYEARFLRKNGEISWCEIRASRLNLDGKTAVLGNVIDISQTRLAQMRLLEDQKLEAIRTLAGGIAHDFNNLLGGILGYASLMLSDISEVHPHYDDINAIAETTRRAADLTNRLLAFARGGRYQISSVDMNKIIEEVIRELGTHEKNHIEIHTQLAESLWRVYGDSHQIHQAVYNVCLNAIEAMTNEGRIIIKSENFTVEPSFAKNHLSAVPGEYVRITVTDAGVGMDDDVRSRMFEPFFTTKHTVEGAGLGLSMVYGIVKNHEGGILVDSEPGKGTEIAIFLPRERIVDEKRDAVPSEEFEVDKEKKHTVLLVDDEPVIRQVVQRMLARGGFEVMVAENGKKALNIYKQNMEMIDLVLLDLIMPVMGGRETFRRLREIDPKIRILFTSGYGPQDGFELAPLGREYFIQKPFQTEVLNQKVRTVLGMPGH